MSNSQDAAATTPCIAELGSPPPPDALTPPVPPTPSHGYRGALACTRYSPAWRMRAAATRRSGLAVSASCTNAFSVVSLKLASQLSCTVPSVPATAFHG